MRILVVEDDQDIRNLVRTRLEMTGYDVFAARNGLDGMRQLMPADLESLVPAALRPYVPKDLESLVPAALTGCGIDDFLERLAEFEARFRGGALVAIARSPSAGGR